MIFIDEETFGTGLSLVFDRNDEPYKIFMVVHEGSDKIEQSELAFRMPQWRSSTGINVRDDPGTVAITMKPTEFLTIKASRVNQIFSISNLNGGR